jgi:hypothetical protein
MKSTDDEYGRYDGPCAYVLEVLEAQAVVLVVIDGTYGSGGSMSILETANRTALALDVPKVLRQMADDAERDLMAKPQAGPSKHVAKGGHGPSSKGKREKGRPS